MSGWTLSLSLGIFLVCRRRCGELCVLLSGEKKAESEENEKKLADEALFVWLHTQENLSMPTSEKIYIGGENLESSSAEE